jgi:hypothetical protein
MKPLTFWDRIMGNFGELTPEEAADLEVYCGYMKLMGTRLGEDQAKADAAAKAIAAWRKKIWGDEP